MLYFYGNHFYWRFLILKKNMKKVTAIMLASSLALSPLQQSSFADTYDICSTCEVCDPLDFVCKQMNEIKGKRGFESKSKGWNIAQKAWHWFFPTSQQKVLAKLANLNIVQQETGVFYSQAEVARAALNTYGEGSGLLSMLGKACSYAFNPYIVSGFLFTTLFTFANNWYKNYKAKLEAGTVKRPVDPSAAMKLFDMKMSNVKGQDKAIKEVKQELLNLVDKNSQWQGQNNSEKAGPGATIIYLIGPSGVGKTMIANNFLYVFAGPHAAPLVIEASDIDRHSRISPVEQLFGMRTKRTQHGGETYEYSPIIQRLKAVPHTVVIINEYDKMHSPELDEKLRTIKDQGYINVNGEKIDCTAAVFIITSNESSDSANKGNLDIASDDDGTGSRTFINHDKAFINRVHLIELDNLTAADYKEIAMRPFSDLAFRYQRQYGIDLDLCDALDDLAQKVEELNRGARPIFNYIENLNDKLLNEVVINNLSEEKKNLKIKVKFNKQLNEFELEDASKKDSLINHGDNKTNAIGSKVKDKN